MQLRVRGLDRVLRLLEDLERLDVAPAARAAAEELRSNARPPVRSGRLRGSLRVTVSGDTATVGSSLVYAGVIHDGWPRQGIEPNPFLTEAVDAGVVDTFADRILEDL